jgi:hypothetical protein
LVLEDPIADTYNPAMPQAENKEEFDAALGANCRWCKKGTLDPGYLEDQGERSTGFVRWVAGILSLGILGNAKGLGTAAKFSVKAYRCDHCGHLELFAKTMLTPGA